MCQLSKAKSPIGLLQYMTDFFAQNRFLNSIESHCLFVKGNQVFLTVDLQVAGIDLEGTFFCVLRCNDQVLKTPEKESTKNPSWGDEFVL